ncbi:hypothetical protein MW887_001392 [Aspergillus wentii]|nr:hypothetical protein MW887_001392 [Aspergillus wentii]
MDFSQSDLPNVEDLLRSGRPFVPFSEFSIRDLPYCDSPELWVEDKLQQGQPFILRGFQGLDSLKDVLNNRSLVSLSPSGAIPVRNCQTGRDVRMRLRELLVQTDNNGSDGKIREQLYAKDLNCPHAWVKALEVALPSCLRQLGSFDLFRVLPKDIASEMEHGSSGFHRCFSGTVALNLLIESEGSDIGSICFGTDQKSQAKYDIFMEELGKSPHTDWTNVSIAQLRYADFPIYVANQKPGDLVVFPSATSHQIWNISSMVTKMVWNIMHTSSLTSFFDYVQPVYQRQCHSDTGRVPLIPLYALESGVYTKDELPCILQMFQRLVDDEDTGSEISAPIKTVDTQGAVVECNFCGITIWNRHMHCEKCGDFDLCLTCFVSGRSCKHVIDYTCTEIVSRERCLEIIKTARSDSGSSSRSRESLRQKSLGALAIAAADARRQSTERLCHLCRDSHAVWKGVTCSKCSAFFCFRGLHRHFDIELIPLLRNEDPWSCPKCSQACNCRCCHFSRPYKSKEKPVRSRVKPIDSRGRILGFVDNVFDQKRGKRASIATQAASPQPATPLRGQKRRRVESEENPGSEQSTLARTRTSPIGSSETPGGHMSDMNDLNRPTTDLRSVESLRSTGQLRISDLVEDRVQAPDPRKSRPHSVYNRSILSSLPRDTSYQQNEHDNEDDITFSATEEDSIPALEKKIEALRRYAEDLLELSLIDSHAQLLERIAQLKSQIDRRRRQKAELLFSNLNRDFPDLATVAREEARRRGL